MHIDLAGSFLGHMFFLVVDAHSKWPKVIMMSSTTSPKIIETLRSLFPRYGLPEQLVLGQWATINLCGVGTVYQEQHNQTYQECSSSSCLKWPCGKVCSEPEQTTESWRKGQKNYSPSTAEFLLAYRSTIHATTNACLSELILGQKLHTHFDLMKPDIKGVILAR